MDSTSVPRPRCRRQTHVFQHTQRLADRMRLASKRSISSISPGKKVPTGNFPSRIPASRVSEICGKAARETSSARRHRSAFTSSTCMTGLNPPDLICPDILDGYRVTTTRSIASTGYLIMAKTTAKARYTKVAVTLRTSPWGILSPPAEQDDLATRQRLVHLAHHEYPSAPF